MEGKDPRNSHFIISMVKSAIRIGAGFVLMSGNLMLAGALFVIAEALGIAEEMF